jgi:surfeit locus 1 family protein
MLAGYSFRPRFWPLALACAGCAAGIALGNWQTGRAEQKRAAAAAVERVVLKGRFLSEHLVLLDNRLRNGRPGYEVLTPFAVEGGRSHVLVNRGWIAAGPSRDVPPKVETPAGVVALEGAAVKGLARAMNVGEARKGRVRQNLDVAAFAAEIRLPLEPRVIQQHSDTPDRLLRQWPRPDAGADKNDAYALQWYALAGLAAVLGAVFGFRRVQAG